ncbi:BRCT domain-containing protein [Rhizobium sp. L1K21]|uniref:BRCT domain-containing protein n=1 Tax=Rhizobium sp. L1K21 TaxID=2954933 RepID=UPI002092EB54|nr:BRCT domain-containing protein [Rhizobium sp. L1K21]MCO6185656.1 BRCT domain-containing protein [Rhizobium sp. L1K21]
MTEDSKYLKFATQRIESRQIDELIGLARGLVADGVINQREVEFLEKWLAANSALSDQPIIRQLYKRVREVLVDGLLDENEKIEILETLNNLSNGDFELGETLKATTLPLCIPAPALQFQGHTYCFTGTFNFGQRKDCENAILIRGGGVCRNITRSTNVLVIGTYATDSWRHSSFGNKILAACEYRDRGIPISIVSEDHWVSHL